MNRQIQALTLIFALLGFSLSGTAQVTIGSGKKPAEGALLDLKDYSSTGTDKTTANKGLLLPRVSLINLKPASATDLPLSIGNTSGESWDLDAHIGLAVFNVTSDQCANEPIPVGSFVWSGTEWEFMGQEGALASGVTKHPAKSGVYEEFYSADFGTAGIWMTTNLTAYKYDDKVKHSTDPGGTATSGSGDPRTLDGPNANPLVGGVYPNNTAYWSYPKPAGVVTPGEAAPPTWDSRLGLLYTWDAATAGKGGTDGQGNIYNTSGGTGANDEYTYPEGTAPGQQRRIQGICPDGWHLPSNREWAELETVIAANYGLYSTGSPSGAGQAMKSPCPTLPGVNPQGLSKAMEQHGFAAFLTGRAYGGSASFYGIYGYRWSASSLSSTHALCRGVDNSNPHMGLCTSVRYYSYSVRCKKD